MGLSRKLQFALVLVITVVVPGVTDYFLSTNGHETIGMFVWAVGYGTGMLLIWFLWFRPLDLTGPV